MARVANLLVVLGVARRVEGVVAAHRVVDDLHHRLEVVREVLGVEARHRVAGAHEAAGGGGVQHSLHAVFQPGGVEALEVRALPSLHVDDLDELAGLHLVGPCRGGPDAEVLVLVGQWGGEDLEAGCRGSGPVDEGDDVGRGVLVLRGHVAARYADHAHHVGRGGHPDCLGRRRVL